MVDERAAVPPRVVSDDEVCACSFEQWYSTFEAHTWRAEWMRPGETFVRFLLADGVCVGHESDAFPDTMAMGHEDDDGEIAQNDVSDADDEEGVLQSFSDFPEVNSWIRSGIERLGGKVVPKLNWSCPYDATWMMANNSVCCTTADEVMLLLKSSDRACHDLSGDAFDPSVDEDKGEEGQRKACAHEPVLVLKKHFDILPGREFRCFVFNGSLIGICQRDVLECYPQTVEKSGQICELIRDMFDDVVKGVFPLRAYTMDVYVTSKNVVRIVDFNTWGGTTQPLLFTWEELIATARALDEENPKGEELSYELSDEDMMRVVREPGQVRPGVRASCGVPFDLVDKTEGGAIDEFLRKHRDDFM